MYVHRLAHALGNAGHEVDVIHCVDSYKLLHPAEPRIAFPDHPKVKTHPLRSGYGWLSPLLTQQTGRPFFKRRALEQILGSKRFDVIHYHNISLFGPRVLALECRGAQTIKMYTAHEHWLVCPMHVLWKFNRRVCDKPACLRCSIIGKRPPQWWRYTALLENASRSVDQFVAPSRFTAKMHAERGFGRPVDYLPYFIERTDRDWLEPGPRPQERPYFLFVGRLELIKGLQTLIPIWDHVNGYDLLVAGTGDYETTLRKMAAPNPNIRFLGALSQKELGSLYHHAIACVIPSITYETFGMIIIEAYARKTPVIVRNLGPFPEAVQESGGGFIYNNDAELLGAIDRVAADAGLRGELGQRGYGAFVRWWSREAHLKLYFDLLQGIAVRKFGYVPWEDRTDTNVRSSSFQVQA